MDLNIWRLLVLFMLCPSVYSNIDRLVADVFTNYNADIRPYCRGQKRLQVSLQLTLYSLNEINEAEGKANIGVKVNMKWQDCRLSWSPSNYSNITHINLPRSKIWEPDVWQMNSIIFDETSLDESYRVNVFSNGTVSKRFSITETSSCTFNMMQFPYDMQRCSVDFGSRSMDKTELEFVPADQTVQLSTFPGVSEWNIVSTDVVKVTVSYDDWPNDFESVQFYITIERRSTYYETYLIYPAVLMAIISLMAHVLPPDVDEKIALPTNIMLALTVYQLTYAELTPRFAKELPWLGFYFTFVYYVNGVLTLSQMFIVRIDREDSEMSEFVEKFIFNPLYAVTHFNCCKQERELVNNSEKWKLLGTCINRISFVVFALVFVIGTIYIFVMMSGDGDLRPIITDEDRGTAKNILLDAI